MRIEQTIRRLAACRFSESAVRATSGNWRDPSSHAIQFITVDHDVRLEVLDWGGNGTPLVLLPGGGDTAHVFDDFAPKLARGFHVYGITRRGFGDSGFAPLEKGSDTFGDDVLAVLDALKLQSSVLLGHSIAGQELSSVATRYPNRVAALVYLDAAYPYAFDNGNVPTIKDFMEVGVPQPPPPTDSDRSSFDALRQYYTRVLGFAYPEGELRQKFSTLPDGARGPRDSFPAVQCC